jgi:hypothetical protein
MKMPEVPVENGASLSFKECAKIKADATLASWRSYDGTKD